MNKTQTIREEYKQSKKQEQEIVTEAAMKWLDNNVVVLSEKIDRNGIKKFVRQVERFEDLFGPYASKLPTISNILDGAEVNLQDVLTGRKSDKRISDTMQYVSYAYNALSDFFSKDLPLLLRTKTFNKARENAEVRLDALSGAGFDANTAQRVFSTAITPSKDEMALIGRIVKKKHIPNIDAKRISSELLSLTFNELQDLTNIGKVPLVVSETDVKKN